MQTKQIIRMQNKKVEMQFRSFSSIWMFGN